MLSLVNHVNVLCAAVITSTLSPTAKSQRVDLLKYWINVGEACLENPKDFNSLCAITAAFDSIPLFRLTNTWKAVGAEARECVRRLSKVTSMSKSYRELRREHVLAEPPFILYLGVFCHDVAIIEESVPDFVSSPTSMPAKFHSKTDGAPLEQGDSETNEFDDQGSDDEKDTGERLPTLHEVAESRSLPCPSPEPARASSVNNPNNHRSSQPSAKVAQMALLKDLAARKPPPLPGARRLTTAPAFSSNSVATLGGGAPGAIIVDTESARASSHRETILFDPFSGGIGCFVAYTAAHV